MENPRVAWICDHSAPCSPTLPPRRHPSCAPLKTAPRVYLWLYVRSCVCLSEFSASSLDKCRRIFVILLLDRDVPFASGIEENKSFGVGSEFIALPLLKKFWCVVSISIFYMEFGIFRKYSGISVDSLLKYQEK